MKKLFILLTIIVLGIMAYTISSTYALYETNRNIEKELNIAKWEINVNDIDAVKTNNIELQNIIWEENEHVASGKVAPSIKGYYDIIIDPKQSDVAIKYEITFDYSNIDNEAIHVLSLQELNNKELITNDDNTYIGIITLDDIENGIKHNIRTTLIWEDIDDNIKDYELGSIYNNQLEIKVSINFSQYLN
ncbi:MAG: hypothetical protein PUC23_03110 [bacterium]|nr:hypothetical protein [bacterium]